MRLDTGTGSRPGYPGILLHPPALGSFVVLLIAAAILLVGDYMVEQNVLGAAGREQSDDLDRFGAVLHISGLGLNSADALERLPEITAGTSFDTAVSRALFGVHAQRLDIYSLAGEQIYSTSRGEVPLAGDSLVAFQSAVVGEAATVHIPPSSSSALLGSARDVLRTFKVIGDASPDSRQAAQPLMVAAISTDVSGRIGQAYNTILLVTGVFTFGSLLIIGLVHWASVRSRGRLEAANRQLALQYEEVRLSRERMVRAADDTKRAIAEELHGTVQTKMYAAWMKLQQVKDRVADEAVAAELARLVDEIDSIREDDIRGLSHRLHPSIVRVGALPALRSLCTYYSELVKTDLSVNEEATALEPPGASRIPEPIRLAVYRIAELALGNVVKHAGATHCEIGWRYERQDGRLVLRVSDDGRGFDTSEAAAGASGGLGIVNISDYADSLGGSVTVESAPGRGTTLILDVPFKAETDAVERRENRRSYTARSVESRPQAA